MLTEQNLKPSTVRSYLSSLATLHKLQNKDAVNFSNYIVKALIRGAENLKLYAQHRKETRKIMTLPLLKLLGHALATCDWSPNSVQVFWACCLLLFFGSLRIGEVLPPSCFKFNPFETLLWEDIIFRKDSILVHVKIPKSKNPQGDFIDIFEFKGHGCCPVSALRTLRDSSPKPSVPNSPVFQFSSGKFLTPNLFNICLRELLRPLIGLDSDCLSAHSFRAALPSALATDPTSVLSTDLKLWGRWHSSSYSLYTRLKFDQRKSLFNKICLVLNKLQS
jgi:hypothetical protein